MFIAYLISNVRVYIMQTSGPSPCRLYTKGEAKMNDPIGDAQKVSSLLDFSVVAKVKVFNGTKSTLSADGYYPAWGQIEQQVASIHPSASPSDRTEAIIGQKTTLLTAGTTGVAAWKIKGIHTRLIVMWSIPWCHAIYSNVLAVGLTTTKASLDNDLYKMMYNESNSWFQKAKYKKGNKCESVRFATENFKVTGIMGTTCNTTVYVDIEERRTPKHKGGDIVYNWDTQSGQSQSVHASQLR